MLTRSQTANKNCKVEKVSTKKTTTLRSQGAESLQLLTSKVAKLPEKFGRSELPENVFTIVRTRSYNNVVEKLQNNKSVVSSIITRSKVNKEVNIDFDGASREWRRNKRSVGNGSFVYTPLNI